MAKAASEKHNLNKPIPTAVKTRLPRYYRMLRELIGADILRVSSSELAARMKLTPSQIRQDFSYLGGVGQQGYGYNVKDLYSVLGNVLGIQNNYSAVIICKTVEFAAAISDDPCFTARGVNLKRIFTEDSGDFSPEEIKTESAFSCKSDISRDRINIRAARFCSENKTDIAVLACGRQLAEETAESLANAGIRGIWNFTGAELDTDTFGIPISNINLSDTLLGLCCEITCSNKRKKGI